MRALLIAILSLLAYSCAPVFADPKSTWHAQSSFSSDERADMSRALADWKSWTRGNVDMAIEYGTAGDPFIVRGDLQTPLAAAQNKPNLLGVTDRNSFSHQITIVIVMPQAEDDLEGTLAHEMGHALGFVHDDLPGQLMSPAIQKDWMWGPEDQAQCEALGYCTP